MPRSTVVNQLVAAAGVTGNNRVNAVDTGAWENSEIVAFVTGANATVVLEGCNDPGVKDSQGTGILPPDPSTGNWYTILTFGAVTAPGVSRLTWAAIGQSLPKWLSFSYSGATAPTTQIRLQVATNQE